MLRRRSSVQKVFTVMALVLAAAATSCSMLPGREAEGSDITSGPRRVAAGRAALDAALAPATWVPLAGALALQLGNADGELSDWAVSETPLFGSNDGARQMSDVLYWTTVAGYGATAVLAHTRGGAEAGRHVGVARRLGVGVVAHAVTSGTTEVVKRATGRARPDGSNERSLPSAHASGAAVSATLAGRNTEWTHMSARSAALVRGGLAALAAGTAWARVEGGRHYPSDVLVGLALGHFVGAFANDAFLGRGPGHGPEVALRCGALGTELCVRWSF